MGGWAGGPPLASLQFRTPTNDRVPHPSRTLRRVGFNPLESGLVLLNNPTA
jgi:hypothetical protein